MHPYVIDRMVQERRDELLPLGQAERGVRAARRFRPAARRMKPRLTARLAALAARLGWRATPRPTLEPCPRAPVRPW